jgi:hypothetical protein
LLKLKRDFVGVYWGSITPRDKSRIGAIAKKSFRAAKLPRSLDDLQYGIGKSEAGELDVNQDELK